MKKLVIFLSLLAFSWGACFSESFYIEESELIQLEKNNQRQKELIENQAKQLETLNQELKTLKTQRENLNELQNQMKIYCEQLEKEKKIIKTVSIGGGVLAICGGFFIGYKLAKD